VCLIASVIALLRWSGPVPPVRKLDWAQFIVCGVLSGVFLLTSKSVSPEDNRKRMTGLLVLFLVFQLIGAVLQ
jgi:hypothetical protein